MELDELKQQWEILHKKLDEQQIINKRLMEAAVRQKISFINSYNLFGIVLALFIIPILIMVQKQKNIDAIFFYFSLGSALIIIGFSAYWSIQFAKKMRVKTNILELEKFLHKYKRYSYISTLIAYIWSIVIFAWSITLYFDNIIAAKMVPETILIYVAVFAFVVWISTRDISRLKKLHQSISDLKEFEKNED